MVHRPTAHSALRDAARAEQRRVRRSERQSRRRARRSLLWRWRKGIYVVGILGVAALVGLAAVISRVQLPQDDPLAETTYVCAADVVEGCTQFNALASFRAEIDREVIDHEQIPTVLVRAVLAAEDRTFFSHGGLDPFGIGRALWHLRSGESLQGGSTITQQYVKNAFLTQERTLSRKLKEAVLAVKVEQRHTKEEILTRYLNTIYFGRGAYGVQAASRAYFGHGVEFLGDDTNSLAKAAYLAGLIRSPETADSVYDVDEADFRRRSVLDNMVNERYITSAQAAAAAAVPFPEIVYGRIEARTGLGPVRPEGVGAEYFVDHVRQWLLAFFPGDAAQRVFTGGLRVYTTLRPDLQAAAYDVVSTTLDRPEDPAASLVAVDEVGRIVAMVGGKDFAVSQVNLALGRQGGGSGRQPGSTFKPFALAAAVESGLSPLSSYLAPERVIFPGANDGEDWTVQGGASTSGSYNLVEAMATSSNTVYAQLMLELGAERVVETANRLGVTAPLPAVPALVLGSGEVSALDMASAFSTFANRGAHLAPVAVTRIEDSAGNLIYSSRFDPKRVMAVEAADTVTAALRRVVTDGTGTRARIGRDAAGKTGTTEDNRDAWFVGYTCTGPDTTLTAAVWMGFPAVEGATVPSMVDVRGVRNVGGGTFPAEMWAAFMNRATDGRPECALADPVTFRGERREHREIVAGHAPEGSFRTTTTPPPTTTTTPATTTTSVATTTTDVAVTTTPPTTAAPGPPAGPSQETEPSPTSAESVTGTGLAPARPG